MALQVVANANEGMKELATKLSLALLRHTDVVPADKAFYLAGMACNVCILFSHFVVVAISLC
jgi:intraflagellar transport protein 172